MKDSKKAKGKIKLGIKRKRRECVVRLLTSCEERVQRRMERDPISPQTKTMLGQASGSARKCQEFS